MVTRCGLKEAPHISSELNLDEFDIDSLFKPLPSVGISQEHVSFYFYLLGLADRQVSETILFSCVAMFSCIFIVLLLNIAPHFDDVPKPKASSGENIFTIVKCGCYPLIKYYFAVTSD